VRWEVSLADFREFVSALEGNAIKITNDNFKGLSALCDEFRFGDLSVALSQFRDSDDSKEAETRKDAEARRRLSALEERVQQRHHQIASLQCELMRRSQAQESAMEAVLQRVSRLEADRAVVGSLVTEVARLKEAHSMLSGKFDKVGQQLREPKDIGLASRAVAEVAQKRAEAHLGRVSRLEAELSALRIACEAELASHRANQVENIRNALGEVRELAERVQTKAKSTEVQLGRVAHLEAEVSSLRIACVPPPPSGWNSAIVPYFPKLFEDFKQKQFTLLWRGSRHGFQAKQFHGLCDGHPNTLTVILDTKGNMFGGFTPVKWDSTSLDKADPSMNSFLFTLKNPHNVPARRFALEAEKKNKAIYCHSNYGPSFYDLGVLDDGNANSNFGMNYTNDTGLNGNTFFTGSQYFQVKEIEVFEITE
jgi:hypothetical protein